MKWAILSFVLCFSLTSCMSSRYYRYKTEMSYPEKSERLYFENDSLSIALRLQPTYIEFTLYNKLNTGIRINWDEVSFSLNGTAYRAAHKSTSMANLSQVQPPSTIPPKSKLEDYIFPSEKVQFMRSIFDYRLYTVKSEIFPSFDYGNKNTKKYIERLKGVRLTIFLPVYIGDKYVSQYYDIDITEIFVSKRKVKWHDE